MSKKASKINNYNEALENAKPRDYNFSGYGEILEEETLQNTNPNPLVYGYEIDEDYDTAVYPVSVMANKQNQGASKPVQAPKAKPTVVRKKVINSQVSQNNEDIQTRTKTVNAHKLEKSKPTAQKQNIPDDLLKYAYDFEKMIQNLLKQAGKKRRMVNKMVADLNKSRRR